MYSPVANVQLLLSLKEEQILPSYLLLLAHEVVQYPAEFKVLTHGFLGTVILDNSLIELGRPADPSVILQAAEIVQPDFVVMPDHLSDAERTVTETHKAATTWAKELPAKSSFLVVAQGKDQIEIVECARNLLAIVKPVLLEKGPMPAPMLGLPRVLTNMGMKRSTIVPMMSQLFAAIHLLGMSDDFQDDMRCFHQRQVVGIDSATPIRCGYEDVKYTLKGHEKPPIVNREKFFHECKEVTGPMIYNIGFINGVIELAKRGI